MKVVAGILACVGAIVGISGIVLAFMGTYIILGVIMCMIGCPLLAMCLDVLWDD